MDENELIIQAGRGDEAAFGLLVDRYVMHVFNRILNRVESAEYAAELTEETFRIAWNGIGLFQFDSSLDHWLNQIADGVCDSSKRRPNVPETIEVTKESLTRVIMGRVKSEKRGFRVSDFLKRIRFTLIALILILVLFLITQSGLLHQQANSTKPSEASPSPTVSIVPAEFQGAYD